MKDLTQALSRHGHRSPHQGQARRMKRIRLLALLSLACGVWLGWAAWRSVSADSQLNISTVAGSALADSPDFQQARGVALTPGGSTIVYVADAGNHVVRKVDTATSAVTIFAGKLGVPAADPTDNNGDGGLATDALLNSPSAVVVDSLGNVLIADTGNNKIRRVSTDNKINTIAGNGTPGSQDGPAVGANPATFSQPRGLAFFSNSLYIADTGSHRIRRLSAGNVSTFAGTVQGNDGDNGLATLASLNTPLDVAADSNGLIYIADTGNHRVRVVKADGNIYPYAGTGNPGFSGDFADASLAALSSPSGVSVGGSTVYIADTGNQRIRQVQIANPNGTDNVTITTVAGISAQGFDGDGLSTMHSLNLPYSVAANANGTTVFVMDSGNRRLRKLTGGILSTVASDGSNGFAGDGDLATKAKLNIPLGAAVDATGNFYLADTGNHVIRKVTIADGKISTIAGTPNTPSATPTDANGDTGLATSATLNRPAAVVIDQAGNVFIADSGNNRVRKIDAGSGNISTIIGQVDAALVGGFKLENPRGLAVDAGGIVYVATTTFISNAPQSTILRWQPNPAPNGQTSIFAGGGNNPAFGLGDGGAATSARLNQPGGVAVDSMTNVYIADTGNHRIRKVTSGTITSVVSKGAVIRSGFEGDGGSAGEAKLTSPTSVAVDATGNYYITDKGNNRIRRVTINDGKINTIIGTGGVGFSGDGGSAALASLDFPNSVAVGTAGVYVVDTSNNRVRLAATPPNTKPTLTSPGDKTVNEGVNLSFTLSASDPDQGQSLAYSMTGAPAGATLNGSTGAFSYTPDFNTVPNNTGATSQFTVTFKATDNGTPPLEDAKTVTITVNNVNRPPTADAGSIPATLEATGPSGAALALNGSAADPDGDTLSVAWTDGPVSIASSLATNVMLSLGTHTLVLTVNDGKGGVVSTAAKTVVVKDTTPPVFTGIPADITKTIPSGTGANVDYTPPTATDTVTGNRPVSVSPPDKTPGAFFPLGPTTVTFTASDGNGNTATASFKVTIFVTGGPSVTTYNIDAFAGNGIYGSNGDGGAASAATFKQPQGVAVDAAGNVYIADSEMRVVRKVNASDGKVNIFAGTGAKGSSGDNGPATSAKLSNPTGLAVDGAGHLYIADTNNHRIRMVSGGTITTVAGSGIAGFGGDGGSPASAKLNYPTAVAIDSAGHLCIADSGNNRIRKVVGNMIMTVAGSGATGYDGDNVSPTSASLDNPTGVAVSADGNTLYIADQGNHRIRKVAGGTITTFVGNGAAGFGGDGNAANLASLNAPAGVVLDSSGNVFITDTGNDRLRKVSADDGKITTIVGSGATGGSGDGGAGVNASLDTPTAIALHASSGQLFFADTGNLRVRKLTPVSNAPPNNNPVPATVPNQSLNKDQLLDVALSATDADGDPVTFTIISGSPLAFLSIVNADPNARTAVLRIAPSGGNVGSYNIKIQATDNKGGSGQTPTFTITINDPGQADKPPVAVISPVASPVEATSPSGAGVSFNGSSSSDPDGDTLTYLWTDNGLAFATTPNANRTLSLGNHSIVLTVNDGKGGSNSASQNVLVRDTTPPTITGLPPSVTFTQGDTVVLPTPTVSDVADPSPTVTNNAPASFPLGTTVVTFTATDHANNSATANVSVTVNPAGPPKLTAINPNSGSKGQTLMMVLSGSNFKTGATVNFSTGDVKADQSTVVVSNGGTQITVKVSVDQNAATTTSTFTRRSVTVMNPGGASSTLSLSFTVK